ncbi:MAG: 3-hydroxyacyl-CoA dehydrogenase NAD-binding domain-containing protein, partial [Bacteroidota bacterium]
LEHPGVPVVAAINGNALGLGFELALACHHRIVLDNPEIRLGLSEIQMGLIPSGGSVIRLMWLLGIERTYHILTSGRRYNPQVALKLGLVDELVSDEKQLIVRAKECLLQSSEGRRPWDRSDGGIPGGTAAQSEVAALIRRLNIDLVRSTYKNFPAQHAILNVLAEGSKMDFDTATRIESRYYTQVICSQEAKNMFQAFSADKNNILNGLSRPKVFGKFRPKKVGIIGAGHMGSGIAYCCARRGLEVVLKDVSQLVAAEGKKRTAAHLDEKIALQEIIPQEKTDILARITTTDSVEGFADCDLVIEAVFEKNPQSLPNSIESIVFRYLASHRLFITKQEMTTEDNHLLIGYNQFTEMHIQQGHALRLPHPMKIIEGRYDIDREAGKIRDKLMNETLLGFPFPFR